MYRLYTALILLASLLLSACNIEAVNDDGKPKPDSTVNFSNVSGDNLPPGLAGNTQQAESADLIGDGAPELILAIKSQPNKILVNSGSGQFSVKSSILSNQSYDSHDLSLADFNDDGFLDLIFVSGSNQPNELYINNGQGSFLDLSNRVNYSGNSTSVNAWDINNDGSADIMIGNRGQNTVLINNGNVFFTNQTAQRIPQQLTPTNDITWADLDGDNWFDIVTAEQQNNRLYLNQNEGFFTDQTQNRTPSTSNTETYDVNLVDVDNDGDLDLYYGNTAFRSGLNAQDRLLINNGDGFFADQTNTRLPEITTNTSDADFADLTGNGYFDIIISNFDGGLRVLINDGKGNFTDQTSDWIEEGFAPAINNIELGDYNGDRLWDLYLSVRDGADQLLLQRSN